MKLIHMNPDKLTSDLIRKNGQLDRKAGKDPHTGWCEICKDLGWDDIMYQRTPVQEIYLDGFYEPV